MEKLAAKGRERQAEKERRAAVAKAKKRSDRKRSADRLQTASLGQAGTKWLIVAMAVIIAGIFGAMQIVSLPRGPLMIGIYLVCTLGLGAGLFFGSAWLSGRARDRELAWLSNLPFRFDQPGYLKALSTRRMRAVVTLRMTFEQKLSEADRKLLVAAMFAGGKTNNAKWNGEALVVVSPPLTTWFHSASASGGSGTYNNARVHQWVQTFIDETVRVAHADHLISKLDVTVAEK